ncbi:MAG TPA: hypothetical protein VNB23_03365, partial [Ramlibacter sp.]|nr:hypothetical protein [Ramlibacter sp.]
GSVLMPFTLLFMDLHQVLKLVLAYGLFLTPALFQPAADGLVARVVAFNPVSPLMVASREAAMGAPLSQPVVLGGVLVAALLMTIAGLLLVRATAPIVIERMLLGGK